MDLHGRCWTSRLRAAAFCLILATPGHGPLTTIWDEAASNPFLRDRNLANFRASSDTLFCPANP